MVSLKKQIEKIDIGIDVDDKVIAIEFRIKRKTWETIVEHARGPEYLVAEIQKEIEAVDEDPDHEREVDDLDEDEDEDDDDEE